MQRLEITSAVICDAERMFDAGMKSKNVAAELKISKYVARLIKRNRRLVFLGTPSPPTERHSLTPKKHLCYTTVRMIERMLAVGILTQQEIAREAGVTSNTVSYIACGKREALTLLRPPLAPGERFRKRPVRCGGCGAMLAVTPCRACSVGILMS